MARGGRGKRKEAREAAEKALESGSVVLPKSSLEAWSVPPSVANPVNWREVKYNPDKSDYYSDYGTVLRDPSEPAITPEEAALQRMADAEQRAANQEAFANATEEEKALRVQNNELEKYGVSSADFGNKVLTDQEMFSLTSRLDREVTNTQTNNLVELSKDNPEKFTEEYGKLQKSSQLKFLNKLYDQNTLSKDDYLNSAAQTLMAADGFDRNVYTIQNGQLYTAPSNMADSASAYKKVILFNDQVTGHNEYNTFDYLIGQDQSAGRDLTGSKLGNFLNSLPVQMFASTLGPTGIAALTGLKAATGETLHAEDWISLALAGAEIAANTTGVTAAEAEQAARSTVETAINEGTVTTATEAQKLYEDTLASIDVSGTFMGVDLTEFASDADTTTSVGQDIADAVSALEEAAQGKGDGIVLNLLEDTVDSPEDAFANTEVGQDTLNDVVDILITAGEGQEETPITGVTPEMPETVVDLEPEFEQEPIVADPIEEVIPQPTIPEVVEQEEAEESGGGGEPAPAPTEQEVAPADSDSVGIAEEEGDVEFPVDTMQVPNPEFDPDSQDSRVLQQIYEAILKETDPVLRDRLEQEYENMGGHHLEEVKNGVSSDTVYADYPPEYIEVPYEESTLDSDAFEAQYPDGWLGGAFDVLDANNDGVVSEIEMYDYEHNKGTTKEEEPFDFIDIIPDTFGDTVTDSITDAVTDVVSDLTGTGEGTGTGNGTGTGDGTGTGTGDGTGDGDGTGEGTGAGTGVGLGNATRTTDSLFGDMLQLETQIKSTQERLRPFSLAPTPSIMPYNEPQPQLLNQFLQQQQDMQLQYQPQRMLTDSRFPKGYNF